MKKKTWIDRLPDVFGRRRISELEWKLEEAEGHIEELEANCEVVSQDFEKDCWRTLRGLLERCGFDWRDADSDGVTADAADEFIREHIRDLERHSKPRRQIEKEIAGVKPQIILGDEDSIHLTELQEGYKRGLTRAHEIITGEKA